MNKEYQEYIKELKLENETLRRQLELTEYENTQNNLLAQKYMALYLQVINKKDCPK